METKHELRETDQPKLQQRRLINRSQLRQRDPRSDMSIWRDVKAGKYPQPVKINGRNFWYEDEIDAWIDSLGASRTTEDA